MSDFGIGNIGIFLIFGGIVLALLPVSPFTAFFNAVDTSEIVRFLGWAFPVGLCLSVLQAWLVAITAFYLIMMLARWIKIID